MSAQEIVKICIKTIAKNYDLDYSDLKKSCKKNLKIAAKFDAELEDSIKELIDLSETSDREDLEEFDIDTIKFYCQMYEVSIDNKNDDQIKDTLWKHFEDLYELGSNDSYSEEEKPKSSKTKKKIKST